MAVFQHFLWGYELTYPDDWVHHTFQGAEGFAAVLDAFDEQYRGADAGHILVKPELNAARKPVGPIWTRHIGMIAGMLGAKQVGSAPWRMGGAVGLEAEIVLPTREGRRLWSGILAHRFIVLKMMALHPRDVRARFEPAATRVISSLRFVENPPGLNLTADGLPLPPNCTTIAPDRVINDIHNPDRWRAYQGVGNIDSLQAFYLREAPAQGWAIQEYIPFPDPSELGFARLTLVKNDRTVILGIMPFGTESVTASSPARLAVKVL